SRLPRHALAHQRACVLARQHAVPEPHRRGGIAGGHRGPERSSGTLSYSSLHLSRGKKTMKHCFAGVLLCAVSIPAALAADPMTPSERKAALAITPELLRAQIRFLSSDLL